MRLGVRAALVDGRIAAGDVEVADGVVVGLGLAPAGPNGLAAAGFVDVQVNGFAGVDFLSADADGHRRAGKSLLDSGVTAYQPTLITAPEDVTTAALREIAAVTPGPRNCSRGEPRILGAHLEGPFLSPRRLGTHPPEPRRDPDVPLLERLLAAGPVTYVTLAPELPGALELVDLLVGRGVIVAAGHSDADAAAAHVAFDRGVRTVTHLFNAMRPFTPRDPGIAGAALSRQDVSVQLIVDGHHLAAETVHVIWRAARGRVALVTDAVAAAGVGDGVFRLGDVPVEVNGGVVRRTDGTLAGSALTMLQAVRQCCALGLPLAEVLEAATAVPARILGRDDVGRLAVGGRADVVVLDDSLELQRVMVGGLDS